ncbi:MAG: ribbon-helix-helix domain-containing protein [Vicinamibacterales bacterium]
MVASKKAKAPKTINVSVRLDQADSALLDLIVERDGVPVSEQIRRGLRMWFEQKGVVKAKRKS